MRELGRYKVSVMVTVDLVAFTYREAYTGAIDVVQDALIESGMGGNDLRVTGIATDSDGSDMVYRYGEVVAESLI